MTPEPIVVGLHLCHDLTIEPSTSEVTLTRIFRNLRSPLYPGIATPFWAFASVNGPEGRGTLHVAIYQVGTGNLVYSAAYPIEFADRFTPVYVRLRFSVCRFPTVGGYEMMFLVDRDVIAQRVFHIVADGVRP